MKDMTPIPSGARSTAAAMANLTDFPDRLSPIVVKELRQGLRQPTFVIAFLCLQALLCIVVVVSMSNLPAGGQSPQVGETVSGFFFVLLAIAILMAQPLRGLNALASEIKDDTLDLLLLTRLNSWRITFGKWLALVFQSALLVVAVLPYLILRYYLGGMQLFAELLGLFTMFVVSASLTGVMVGFSATPSMLIRGLAALALLLLWGIVPQFMMFLSYGLLGGRGGLFSITLTGSEEVMVYAGMLLMLGYVGYYFLEMAATQISPCAENRSTSKRISGIVALALIAWLLAQNDYARFICWMLLATLLTIDALSERPEFTASVLRPFRRLGPLKLLSCGLLLPGWPSGLIYVTLLALGTIAWRICGTAVGGPANEDVVVFCLLWFAMLLFPAMVTCLFLNKSKNRFGSYIIVLLLSNIFALVLFLISQATSAVKGMLVFVLASPTFGLLSMMELNSSDRRESLMALAVLTLAGYWIALSAKSLIHWKRIQNMDRQLEAQPKPPPAAEAIDSPEPAEPS